MDSVNTNGKLRVLSSVVLPELLDMGNAWADFHFLGWTNTGCNVKINGRLMSDQNWNVRSRPRVSNGPAVSMIMLVLRLVESFIHSTLFQTLHHANIIGEEIATNFHFLLVIKTAASASWSLSFVRLSMKVHGSNLLCMIGKWPAPGHAVFTVKIKNTPV